MNIPTPQFIYNIESKETYLSTTYLEALDDLRTNKSGLTIRFTSSLDAIIQCTPAAASKTALLLLHNNGEVHCSKSFTSSLLLIDVKHCHLNSEEPLLMKLDLDKYSSGPSI